MGGTRVAQMGSSPSCLTRQKEGQSAIDMGGVLDKPGQGWGGGATPRDCPRAGERAAFRAGGVLDGGLCVGRGQRGPQRRHRPLRNSARAGRLARRPAHQEAEQHGRLPWGQGGTPKRKHTGEKTGGNVKSKKQKGGESKEKCSGSPQWATGKNAFNF